MSSRAPGASSSGAAGLAPEPVDAPPPTQPVQGLSFKDAVLEPAGSKPAATSPRGKAAAKGGVQMQTKTPMQPQGAPRGKRGQGEGEGKASPPPWRRRRRLRRAPPSPPRGCGAPSASWRAPARRASTSSRTRSASSTRCASSRAILARRLATREVMLTRVPVVALWLRSRRPSRSATSTPTVRIACSHIAPRRCTRRCVRPRKAFASLHGSKCCMLTARGRPHRRC